MTKPLRSPVLGYNHNLRYRGRLFHVQTEDSGPVNPHLFTHLFIEGTILSSKKHKYDPASHEDSVKLLMQNLHKTMIRELTHGEHDPRIVAFFATRGQQAFADPLPAASAAPGVAATTAGSPAASAAPSEAAPAPVPAPSAPHAPPVIQVTGVVAGSIDAGSRRPSPVAVVTARAQVTPRPVVMVKPTDMKRPPMVFSSSADGVVVQRNVVISVGGNGQVTAPAPASADVTLRIRPAAVVGDASPVSPPQSAQPATVAAAAPRARVPSPIEKPFTDLVSDKSLDEVILEYLSDDGEPESR